MVLIVANVLPTMGIVSLIPVIPHPARRSVRVRQFTVRRGGFIRSPRLRRNAT
jgi:hypothetical protein